MELQGTDLLQEQGSQIEAAHLELDSASTTGPLGLQ